VKVATIVPESTQFLREVRAEVKKVTWPTVDELKRSTGVIIVFVILIGLLIGLMDFVFAKLLVEWLGGLFA